MERLTLAQVVGEAPVSSSVIWYPEELNEWFAGDTDAASEHLRMDREARIAELEREISELRAESEIVDTYVDGWD